MHDCRLIGEGVVNICCHLFSTLTPVMPKQIRPVPTTLYDHKARNMVARQLNLSRSVTRAGRSSYSSTSSQFSLKPLPVAQAHAQAQVEHELNGTPKATSVAHPVIPVTGCSTEVATDKMDIDGGYMANPGANVGEDADQPAEVMLGIQATTKPKGPSYENSVCQPVLISLYDDLHVFTFQDVPLKTWINFRDDILDVCMVLDGRGPFHELCADCRAPNPLYRCQECALGRPLWCQLCMLKRHSQSPLHIVEVRRTLPFPVVFSDNDGYRDASAAF